MPPIPAPPVVRRAPVLLLPALLLAASALAACRRAGDARTAAQARYEDHTLQEWWDLRRDPDDAVSRAARDAMRMLGPTAVPFLADKAASHELGEMIGGSSGLEGMCTSAIPAMEAARDRYPSAALDAAIRRVKADAADRVRFGFCTADGKPTRPEDREGGGGLGGRRP